MNAPTPLLSIVIPVGPGDDAWRGLLERLAFFPAPCQIVVSACRPLGASIPPGAAGDIDLVEVNGSPGRAAQLNRGVAAASAECLWLVHADSRPDPAALTAAIEFAETANATAMRLGWFRLAFAADGPRMAALNAHGANLRSRILQMPFGDQAWLMHRAVFDRVGGFDEDFGRGEDLDFVIRARAAGARVESLKPLVRTSARRYRDQGWLRTTLAHIWLTLRLHNRARRRAAKRRMAEDTPERD